MLVLAQVLLHEHLDGGLRGPRCSNCCTHASGSAGAGRRRASSSGVRRTRPCRLARRVPARLRLTVQVGDGHARGDGSEWPSKPPRMRCARAACWPSSASPRCCSSCSASRPTAVEALVAGLEGPARLRAALRADRLCHARAAARAHRIARRGMAAPPGQGVIAFDLAGPEAGHPATVQASLLAHLRAGGHAPRPCNRRRGRCGLAAIEAARLGALPRGPRRALPADLLVSSQAPDWLAELRERGVHFEVCPTSNVHTGAAASVAAHPIGAPGGRGPRCRSTPTTALMSMHRHGGRGPGASARGRVFVGRSAPHGIAGRRASFCRRPTDRRRCGLCAPGGRRPTLLPELELRCPPFPPCGGRRCCWHRAALLAGCAQTPPANAPSNPAPAAAATSPTAGAPGAAAADRVQRLPWPPRVGCAQPDPARSGPGRAHRARAGGRCGATGRPGAGCARSVPGTAWWGHRRPGRRHATGVGPFRHEPTIEALNLIGVDVAALGNRKPVRCRLARSQGIARSGCDGGQAPAAGVAARACALRPHRGARYATVVANVHGADGLPIRAPSWVREVGGVRVGFIGAVTAARRPSWCRQGSPA